MTSDYNLKALSAALGSGDKRSAQYVLDKLLEERQELIKNGKEQEIGHELKVYVAGPYTPHGASLHDAARFAHENTVMAINVGTEVITRGHQVYIPHLSHFVHLYGSKTLSYKYYTEADIVWLGLCDAILYYNHKVGESSGADNELKLAIESGKQVFFFVDEIPVYKAGAERNSK